MTDGEEQQDPRARVCALPGCDNTFIVNPQGFGANRKFCDDHRTQKERRSAATVDPTAPTPAAASQPAEAGRPAGSEVVPRSGGGKRGLRERVRGWGKKKPGGGGGGSERAPRRSAPRGRRVPLDTDISDAWAFIGRRLEATSYYPVGRMLQYQAPAAGVIIDKPLAGTLVDRTLLQPLARSRDKWEDTAFLLAGPIITFSITRTAQLLQAAMDAGDQEQADALQRRMQMEWEGFDWLLSMMLPRLVEGKKRAEAKQAEQDAMVADAFPELAGTGQSPAEALRDMLFAPPTMFVPAQPREEQPQHAREASNPAGNGHQPGSVADPGSPRRGVESAPGVAD